jgi:hypothetical protein
MNLKNRYLQLFPASKVEESIVQSIELSLGIVLPDELKTILEYYDASEILGSLSLFHFSNAGDWSVGEQTNIFRDKISLPKKYLVLQEGNESFIVLETQSDSQKDAPVFWVGVSDVYNLIEGKVLLDNPTIFSTFTDFFEYLLDEEEKNRAESLE